MQNESGRLKIHTSMRPEEPETVRDDKNAAAEEAGKTEKKPRYGILHTKEQVETDLGDQECYEKSGACLLKLFPPHSAED
jgi:hypothetical protein